MLKQNKSCYLILRVNYVSNNKTIINNYFLRRANGTFISTYVQLSSNDFNQNSK